ncbi:splicing factor, CC1-like protein [Massarina eburnea CBS 473.64]|uniref:Splicing factor, CC1-like protein n=1 Tax=Massarina eburnea CBS 473.64 TaxID=1395130 RepID=A0A6A6S3L2_9PLEO|nr:splicing factor, CC1-like protein [Massarina eburnea CBS 473.64]
MNASQIDALLEDVAQEVQQKQRKLSEGSFDRERHRDRNDRGDRALDRARARDVARDDERSSRSGRDHDRADRTDRYTGRPQRELDEERRSSRERVRRDGSKAHSNEKDVDTDEDRNTREMSRDTRDRGRDHYRGERGGRDRRGGDYYNGARRDRTRSRSPRHDRDRRGRGDRSYRDRSRDRRPDRRGSGRRRTPTPEVTEDDRDKRTIFVQQISQRAEIRHLKRFFETVGPVVEAQIVKDRVTMRSKGVGYVEFKNVESVALALELTGQQLKGIPIIAQLTEAEKNRASRTTAGDNGGPTNNSGAPFHRLYIGNVHFSVSEEDLKGIFEPYGDLEQIALQRDDVHGTNRSKGYGYVQFVSPDSAKEALKEMNGFELAGRSIRLGLGNDKFTPESTAHLLRIFPQQAASYQGSAFSGAGGRGAYAGGSGGVFDRTHGKDDRGVSGASALDDSDMAGVNFKQVDRNKLMANLARNQVDIPAAKEVQPAKTRAAAVDKLMVSKCIKVEGAFDSDEELRINGPGWMKKIEGEFKSEFIEKYGKLVHIAVDPNDAEIFAKFSSLQESQKAIQGLNGRLFGGRFLRAAYVVEKIYESLYGSATSKA